MKTAINLTEMLITLFEEGVLEETLQEYVERGADEIYIGSYFCEKYFLHINDEHLSVINGFANEHGLGVSIVVPMTSEKDLKSVKDKLSLIMNRFSCRVMSIVVNDFGMMGYVSASYDVPLVIGRLLNKKSRDIRYSNIKDTATEYEVCSSYLHEIIAGYNIKAFEFDDIEPNTVFSNRYGYEVNIHTPITYMSNGMVCEFASANSKLEHKFRPNHSCAHQCSKCHTAYKGVNGIPFYKVGRTIYFKSNPRCAEAKGVSKVIQFPFERIETL